MLQAVNHGRTTALHLHTHPLLQQLLLSGLRRPACCCQCCNTSSLATATALQRSHLQATNKHSDIILSIHSCNVKQLGTVTLCQVCVLQSACLQHAYSDTALQIF